MTGVMKRKTYGAGAVKIIKTSISLPEPLLDFAEQRQSTEGFYSLSAYLTHLIRMDKERKESGASRNQTTAPALLNEGAANSPSKTESKAEEILDVVEKHYPSKPARRK
jgi:Arc/MetJ-type ribon-helix-helix transcriptional regulator